MNEKLSPTPEPRLTLQARALVSQEELDALLGSRAAEFDGPAAARRTAPAKPAAKSPVDTWFKHRILFLVFLGMLYAVKLTFFIDSATSNFSGLAVDAAALADFARLRVFVFLLMMYIYLYSYLKGWYFEKISVLFVGLVIGALAFDYANAYMFLVDKPPSAFMLALLALRLMVVYCMVMNALNAHRAPPMPRRLWF